MIDTHVHSWWPGDGFAIRIRSRMAALDRDFRLERLPRDNPQERIVLVSAAQEAAETERLLRLAADHPDRVARVVGFVDPDDRSACEILAGWQARPVFAGLRFPLVVYEDPNWLARDPVARLLDQLEAGGHVAQILAGPEHLALCAEVPRRRPGLTVLLDHAGNPPFDEETLNARWAEGIDAISSCRNAWCKLGDLRNADRAEPLEAARAAVVRRTYERFGPERIVWGSNWPVCSLYEERGAVFGRLRRLSQELEPASGAFSVAQENAWVAARRLFTLE